MPVVKINIAKGKSGSEKSEIRNAIQYAIKEVFNMNHNEFHHRIYEFEKENLSLPPGKSDNYILIELDIFPGREKDVKKLLFKKIEENLIAQNFKKDEIMIIYREPDLSNWFISGKSGEDMV